MDQFDLARIKAKKEQDKRVRYQPLVPNSPSKITDELSSPLDQAMAMGEHFAQPTMHLTKPEKVKPPKAPMKRTNEIEMTVYVNGDEFLFTAFVNFNDIIASQRTKAGISTMLKRALEPIFGRTDVIVRKS